MNLKFWVKPEEEVPLLQFTDRQTSPYMTDNVMIMHTGKTVRGTIQRTPYNTFKCTLSGSNAEYMDLETAIEMCKKKWESWYK